MVMVAVEIVVGRPRCRFTCSTLVHRVLRQANEVTDLLNFVGTRKGPNICTVQFTSRTTVVLQPKRSGVVIVVHRFEFVVLLWLLLITLLSLVIHIQEVT
jgi:hypothetical protein